ncbi:tripartite motif-containing protein 2-like [Anneissia japonica]|uniref:tripartite motif-containing protein 2-like n=1 Tax=Anneissia japonica TaxID=1529436 RepID=UPI0014258841|nr:tripartite motif-containing protein 2-like [Anneissia japonica]XP_033113239.1 tripartite motif-containing protein 2-like [Anneissia japonica]
MAACSEGMGSSPSSLEDSDSIANTLDETFLQCPIHLERFINPKMLPCLHSVCYDCLEQWVEKKDGILECPECRKEHPIPNDGLKGLPDNFHVNNLIEFLQKVGGKSRGNVEGESATHTCGLCKKSDEVELWCIDCAFYLCTTCIPIHNTMAGDHDTLPIEEFDKLSDSQKIHLKPVYCNKHPKFKVEYFCKTCELPVCQKCTIVQHKAPDHNLEEIEDTYNKMSQALKEQITKANKKKDSANRALDTMQHVQEELQEQHIQALEDAENHVESLKAMLDMNMTIMRMEIEQDYQKKEAVLEEWRSKIKFFSKEITEGVYFAENLLKFGNFMTVTTTSKQASVCLKSLITEHIPKQAKYDFKVQFFPNEEFFDQIKEASLGSVEKQNTLLEKAKDATCPRNKKKGSKDAGVHEEQAGGDDQENLDPDSEDGDKSKSGEPSNGAKNKRKPKTRGKKKKKPSVADVPDDGVEEVSDAESTTSDVSFISDASGLTSYSKSFIINANPKKPCIISKEIHLRLLMKNENNQPVKDSARNRTILVEIERPSSGGKREVINVRDRGSDQCHIKFTPSDIGTHKVFVRINGETIKRYPFSLNVSTGMKSTSSDSMISGAKAPSSPLRKKHGHPAPVPLLSIPLLPSSIAVDAKLREPLDVAVLGDGRLVITNRSSRRVAVLDSKGDFSHNVSVPQSDESPFNPTGITADPTSSNGFYVTDAEKRKFYHLDADNNLKGNFFSSDLQTPMGITTHKSRIYIVDHKGVNVKVFSTLGWLLNIIGRAPHNIFKQPWFVAANSRGYLIICDSGESNVKIVNEMSQVLHVFPVMNKGRPTGFPTGVAVAPNDNIIISSTPKDGPPMIFEYSPVGKFIRSINFSGDKLKLPRGMAIARRGNRTILYVVDMHGNCVRQAEL